MDISCNFWVIGLDKKSDGISYTSRHAFNGEFPSFLPSTVNAIGRLTIRACFCAVAAVDERAPAIFGWHIGCSC
jgi:hypothetical protein